MKLTPLIATAAVLLLAGCGSSAATVSAPTSASPTASPSATASPTTSEPDPTNIVGTVASQPANRDVVLWWATVRPAFDAVAADVAKVNDPNGYVALSACVTLKTDVDKVAAQPAPFDELEADVTAMVETYSAFSYACLHTPDDPTRDQLLATGNARAAAIRARVAELS